MIHPYTQLDPCNRQKVDRYMERDPDWTPQLQGPKLSERDFLRFSDFIFSECGIKLTPAKKTMLSVRLFKRLRTLGMTSFRQYFEYVSSPKGRTEELVHMIDVVSTNKTDFFREPGHFDFLMRQSLPNLIRTNRFSSLNKLNVWSAGCSSGEEPYTLAMVLADFFEKRHAGDYTVLGTDISTRVLALARRGIYPETVVKPIRPMLKHKYLMRGKGSWEGYYRIVPELCNHVIFQRLNLNEGRNFGINRLMDIIFCRNVIIYFDRQTQIKLFEKFYAQLAPGGYMFIGHSETLHGINGQFTPMAPSIYRKPE
jgi:chemotaxis protein methyltransferase CheR